MAQVKKQAIKPAAPSSKKTGKTSAKPASGKK